MKEALEAKELAGLVKRARETAEDLDNKAVEVTRRDTARLIRELALILEEACFEYMAEFARVCRERDEALAERDMARQHLADVSKQKRVLQDEVNRLKRAKGGRIVGSGGAYERVAPVSLEDLEALARKKKKAKKESG